MKVMGNREVQEMEQTGVRKCNGLYQVYKEGKKKCAKNTWV